MKKVFLISALVIIIIGKSPLSGQQLNGQKFTFQKGKTEWSDTIYKKLLTKKMAKEGQKAVLLAIRYKLDRVVDEGNWYQIEITNKSHVTKVKFDVSSSHNQDVFTVKLNPDQTRIFKKLYYKRITLGTENTQDNENEFYISPYEDLLENRD
jgi:hypothetical protein